MRDSLKVPDYKTDMENIDNVCFEALSGIRNSRLNYELSETPFSFFITVRKSLNKMAHKSFRKEDTKYRNVETKSRNETLQAKKENEEDLDYKKQLQDSKDEIKSILDSAVTESMAAKAELELEVDSLKRKLADFDKLNVSMEEIKKANSSLKDESKAAVKRVKDEADAKFKKKDDETRKLIESKDMEISILKTSLKTLQTDKEALDKQVKESKKEIVGDKKEINRISSKLENLEVAKKALKAENHQLRNENNHLKKISKKETKVKREEKSSQTEEKDLNHNETTPKEGATTKSDASTEASNEITEPANKNLSTDLILKNSFYFLDPEHSVTKTEAINEDENKNETTNNESNDEEKETGAEPTPNQLTFAYPIPENPHGISEHVEKVLIDYRVPSFYIREALASFPPPPTINEPEFPIERTYGMSGVLSSDLEVTTHDGSVINIVELAQKLYDQDMKTNPLTYWRKL